MDFIGGYKIIDGKKICLTYKIKCKDEKEEINDIQE